MRRAFVGFSTPIGYSYQNPAPKARNDNSSSPNPVLFGSMGLFTLYDEIYFACESLCPASMRGLDYVKFFDQPDPGLDLNNTSFKIDVETGMEALQSIRYPQLNDVFFEGYNEGMTAYLGEQLATDNHTHGLDFLGTVLSGNLNIRQFIIDLWLISRFKNLNLELALNPFTAQLGSSKEISERRAALLSLGLADEVLTFGSLYDIVGREGPYHPCVEELRNDELLASFRKWMREETSKLDNQTSEMIVEDVNNKVDEFNERALRKYVAPESASKVICKVATGEVLGKIPGGGAISTVLSSFFHNQDIEIDRWKAFVALNRGKVEKLRSRAA